MQCRPDRTRPRKRSLADWRRSARSAWTIATAGVVFCRLDSCHRRRRSKNRRASAAIERDTHGTDGVVSTIACRPDRRPANRRRQLPDYGSFDLRLETADGLIAGWNASVPASDDEPPAPLSADQKRELLDKLATMSRRAFPHEVVVLDIQGNAQHAAILTTSVRRGNIQGVGAVGGLGLAGRSL